MMMPMDHTNSHMEYFKQEYAICVIYKDMQLVQGNKQVAHTKKTLLQHMNYSHVKEQILNDNPLTMKTQVIGSNEYLIMVISHLMAKHNTKLMWHPYLISSHLISSHVGTTLGGRETCKIYLFLKFARGNPTFTTHQSRAIQVSKKKIQNQNHN